MHSAIVSTDKKVLQRFFIELIEVIPEWIPDDGEHAGIWRALFLKAPKGFDLSCGVEGDHAGAVLAELLEHHEVDP